MKILKGATVYTMNKDNETIENCDVAMKDGKITYIGENPPEKEGAEVIDATGCIVTPGLIDAHTHVGLWSDANETSHPYTPLLDAIDAINPHHQSFADARSGGVTTVQTGAGSANPIGGVWSIVKTTGNTIDEMLIRYRSGLKGATGENAKNRYGQVAGKDPFTRMSIAKWIRNGFYRAKKTLDEGKTSMKDLYKEEREDVLPFIEVLENKMPLRIHAHRSDDIVTAIRIAKEFDIDLSIEHCTEGYKVLSYLKESRYPVTLGPFMGQPSKREASNMNLEQPRILSEAGILFAINTDHPVTPIQYLSICAADAVKHGLDETEALRAITIHPAMIGEIDDRVGSIEVGKDADFAVWSHHPFTTEGRLLYTIIDGTIVYQD